jgi:hypothetical protein
LARANEAEIKNMAETESKPEAEDMQDNTRYQKSLDFRIRLW